MERHQRRIIRLIWRILRLGYGNGPVKCDDNGVELEAIMVAGSVGIQRSESGKALDDGGFGVDCMQPVTGWWMFEKHAAKK